MGEEDYRGHPSINPNQILEDNLHPSSPTGLIPRQIQIPNPTAPHYLITKEKAVIIPSKTILLAFLPKILDLLITIEMVPALTEAKILAVPLQILTLPAQTHPLIPILIPLPSNLAKTRQIHLRVITLDPQHPLPRTPPKIVTPHHANPLPPSAIRLTQMGLLEETLIERELGDDDAGGTV